MSVEQTQTTMTAYLDTLVQRGDYARYFSDEVTWLTVGPNQELHGREAVGQFIRWFHEQAFDAAPRLKNLFVADGKAAIEADFVGRHTAEFFGVAATGREVNIPYCVIYDLAGRRLPPCGRICPLICSSSNSAPRRRRDSSAPRHVGRGGRVALDERHPRMPLVAEGGTPASAPSDSLPHERRARRSVRQGASGLA